LSKYILFILIIFSFLNCSSVKEENEPNNNLSQAQIVKFGDVVEGEISTKADRDYYSLNVIGNKWINKSLYIVLEHTSKDDLVIDIYKNNKLIKIVDNYASFDSKSGRKPLAKGKLSSEIFANLSMFPASYHFVVRASKKQYRKIRGSYKISFLEEVRSDFSEIEPNDNFESANLIENDTAIEGYYSPGTNPLKNNHYEGDYFKVNISATNKTLLSVEVSGVPGIDPILSIYNEAGKLMKKVNNSGLHRGEKIKNIGIKQNGNYYILVRAAKLFVYNNKIPYSIKVEITSYSYGEELEPNDKLREANPIKVDEKVSGMLSSVSDKDFYSFIVPQPGSYMFSARLKDLLDVNSAITLYNSYGKKIREFNSAGVGQAEYIANIGIKTIKYDEKYFIKVHSKKGYNDNDKYEMIISLFESSLQGEYEPNDTLNSSNGLIKKVVLFILKKMLIGIVLDLKKIEMSLLKLKVQMA